MCNSASPGGKAAVEIELVELLPQDEARLLQQVFGIGCVGDESVDEAVQPPLMEREQLHEHFVSVRTMMAQDAHPLSKETELAARGPMPLP